MTAHDRTCAQSSFVIRLLAATTLALAATATQAADLLPTTKAEPAAQAPQSPFFVKLGFLYAYNQSRSSLYNAANAQIPGVGADIANVTTIGFEAGYYVTPQVSIDISAGIPMWAKVKTTNAAINPPGAPPGTQLSSIMPSFIPVTVLYHFNQFGSVQPYVGAGAAAMFSLSNRDAFTTGVTVDPTVGLVLQAGADIMVDRHWGWSLDVKKLFATGESHTTGLNLNYIGVPANIASAGAQKTTFTPWVFSTGVTYRF